MDQKLEIKGLTFRHDKAGLQVIHHGMAGAKYQLNSEEIHSLYRFISPVCNKADDQRMDFRVAVTGLSGLDVHLSNDDKQVHVIPVDISYTGIFIKFGSDVLSGISIGSRVNILLDYADEKLQLAGIVRRVTGNGLGISFPDSIHDEKLEPTHGLIRIVTALQINSR